MFLEDTSCQICQAREAALPAIVFCTGLGRILAHAWYYGTTVGLIVKRQALARARYTVVFSCQLTVLRIGEIRHGMHLISTHRFLANGLLRYILSPGLSEGWMGGEAGGGGNTLLFCSVSSTRWVGTLSVRTRVVLSALQ